jgi:hypothetical protein
MPGHTRPSALNPKPKTLNPRPLNPKPYAAGRVADAESEWESACNCNVGCGRYRDMDYVRRIRRWPPVMVDKLEAFLNLKRSDDR